MMKYFSTNPYYIFGFHVGDGEDPCDTLWWNCGYRCWSMCSTSIWIFPTNSLSFYFRKKEKNIISLRLINLEIIDSDACIICPLLFVSLCFIMLHVLVWMYYYSYLELNFHMLSMILWSWVIRLAYLFYRWIIFSLLSSSSSSILQISMRPLPHGKPWPLHVAESSRTQSIRQCRQ